MKSAKNWNQDLIYYIDYGNGIRKLIRVRDLKVTRSTVHQLLSIWELIHIVWISTGCGQKIVKVEEPRKKMIMFCLGKNKVN